MTFTKHNIDKLFRVHPYPALYYHNFVTVLVGSGQPHLKRRYFLSFCIAATFAFNASPPATMQMVCQAPRPIRGTTPR